MNPSATANCEYCPVTNADQLLAAFRIYWNDRWRNFGIFWTYIVFDIFMAVLLYNLFRVRKASARLSDFRLPWSK